MEIERLSFSKVIPGRLKLSWIITRKSNFQGYYFLFQKSANIYVKIQSNVSFGV